MRLREMTKEELETLSYTDIAYMILSENKKAMNTPTIFKKICKLLGYSEDEYVAKVGDFYTSLTTDRRFILLETADWDLRDKHIVKIVVEDDEEIDDECESEDDEEMDIDDNIDEVLEVEECDEIDDDMDDLSIVDDEEIEEKDE